MCAQKGPMESNGNDVSGNLPIHSLLAPLPGHPHQRGTVIVTLPSYVLMAPPSQAWNIDQEPKNPNFRRWRNVGCSPYSICYANLSTLVDWVYANPSPEEADELYIL